MFDKLKRKLGWLPIDEREDHDLPIDEREYHDGFKGCGHHWNWERFGQCPQCARSTLEAINWSLVDGRDFKALQGIIKATKEINN
jgi:hypothetical protein